MKIKKSLVYNLFAPLLGLGLIVGIWWIIAASIDAEIILPTPSATFARFFKLFSSNTFYAQIGMTIIRSLVSFIVAFALAGILGAISARFEFFKKAFAPFVVLIRIMPTISVILLVLVWFYSEIAPYIITFIVIFPMMYTTILDAANDVDLKLVEMADIYGLSIWRKISKVYLPCMLPRIFTGMKITLPFCVKLTVAAEVLAFTADSVGRNLQMASVYLDTALLFAWTLIAILLGFLFELLVVLLRRILLRYEYAGK